MKSTTNESAFAAGRQCALVYITVAPGCAQYSIDKISSTELGASQAIDTTAFQGTDSISGSGFTGFLQRNVRTLFDICHVPLTHISCKVVTTVVVCAEGG